MILSLVNKLKQMSQMLEAPLDDSFHVIMLGCYVCLKIKQLSDGLQTQQKSKPKKVARMWKPVHINILRSLKRKKS